MLQQNNYKPKRSSLISPLALALVFSFPVVGFIYGFFKCKDCGTGLSSIIGRLFIGCVEAVLTTVTLGAPWKNGGGTSTTNLRPFVLVAFLILTVIFYLKERIKTKRNTAKP